MLPLSSPPQMLQGSLFRSSPGRLSFSLCSSVSRRIPWFHLSPWSCSLPPQSVSPSAPLATSCSPPSTDFDHSSLPPLPSERFRQIDSGLTHGTSHEGSFRSVGSRSEPSRPSIPGKFSKYSKPISRLHAERSQKRAERIDKKPWRKPMGDVGRHRDGNVVKLDESPFSSVATANAASEDAVGDAASEKPRRKPSGNTPLPPDQLPDWMKQGYQFSYSEAPNAPIVGFRETPWSPFGPADLVARPWTGCAPLKPQRKKVPEFDSFNPPPPGKKGVKFVQKPGPFPPGQGPKPAKTREEILGEPLTRLEIKELVDGLNKRRRQLNLGRDGLTHNMLIVIHEHWKRSVVCKIKCMGVPTLDMDNLCRVIEDKTGGVIIHRTGGVIHLFRGRNYNYKDRPIIPVMLWKPPDPIYPRLIKPVPEGLTGEEAKRLRGLGRNVAPLCKLSKNGVYLSLVAEVRAQLEIDEVVRVDCRGLSPTDYKKIGAKLKELVPCTLLSFEKEQVIVTRKKLALVKDVEHMPEGEQAIDGSIDEGNSRTVEDFQQTGEGEQANDGNKLTGDREESVLQVDSDEEKLGLEEATDSAVSRLSTCESDNVVGAVRPTDGDSQFESPLEDRNLGVSILDSDGNASDEAADTDVITEDVFSVGTRSADHVSFDAQDPSVSYSNNEGRGERDKVKAGASMPAMNDVDTLWQKAIEEGKALELDNQNQDPDVVFEKASELPGIDDEAVMEEDRSAMERVEQQKIAEQRNLDVRIPSVAPFSAPPLGGLGVDELARLLAP